MSEQVSAPRTDEQARVEAAAEHAAQGEGRLASIRNHSAIAPFLRNLGLVLVLIVLAIIGTATSDNFLTSDNMRNILVSASVIGVVTVGMTFVIIGGGIDLSVGALVALSSVWATTLATQAHGPWIMIMCALMVGTACGVINGAFIAYGNLVPFIVTLAMMVSARGLAAKLADNKTQIVNVAFVKKLALEDAGGIPYLVIIFAVVVLLGWLLLNRTTYGRRTFALGGNAEAARLAGINIRRHTLLLYALSGLCCGIAAIMLMARTTTGSSTHGSSTSSTPSLPSSSAARCSPGEGHPDRLDPRCPRLPDHHQHLHPQQLGDRGAEHRQGHHHPRRRPAPDPCHKTIENLGLDSCIHHRRNTCQKPLSTSVVAGS